LALSLADRLSTKGPAITDEIMRNAYENHMGLMLQYLTEQENLRQPPLVNGHEIMDRFNLSPGPHLRRALDALIEAQQLSEVQTGPDAMEWLAHHIEDWLPEGTDN
jgi:poly(A) polymerase